MNEPATAAQLSALPSSPPPAPPSPHPSATTDTPASPAVDTLVRRLEHLERRVEELFALTTALPLSAAAAASRLPPPLPPLLATVTPASALSPRVAAKTSGDAAAAARATEAAAAAPLDCVTAAYVDGRVERVRHDTLRCLEEAHRTLVAAVDRSLTTLRGLIDQKLPCSCLDDLKELVSAAAKGALQRQNPQPCLSCCPDAAQQQQHQTSPRTGGGVGGSGRASAPVGGCRRQASPPVKPRRAPGCLVGTQQAAYARTPAPFVVGGRLAERERR